MDEKQLVSVFRALQSELKVEQFAKLFYCLVAWKRLSSQVDYKKETFEYFCTGRIETEIFQYAIKDLSTSLKLFKLFLDQNIRLDKVHNDDLIQLCNIVNETSTVPNVFDFFYSILDGYMSFTVANQIADLGVKLLDGECREIYAPFSNGYNIAYYTDKKILAESFADEYIMELMRIIDGVDIEFTATDPLATPTYIDHGRLKQFHCVLSFPPMGLSTNNEFLRTDIYQRFRFHNIRSNKDVAHLEHILAQTGGKAVVLMPVGFTYRGKQDKAFRAYLIKNNWLEAVIQLPPNLHHATSIETTFIIINKRKNDDTVYFLNVKHESFLKREGRKLVLNDIDHIVSIYEEKRELENISRLVKLEEIGTNNYSLAIDRYIISKEIAAVQKKLQSFQLVKLEDIADIRRSQLFKDEGEGKEVYEVSPSDFNKAGFLLECGKIKQIGSQYRRFQTYKLEPYDVLLSTKGTIGKVAIVGEICESMIASQAVQVIRLKDDDKKERAIALYMFFKSTLGQTILSTLVSGVAMPQIATAEVKKLDIPVLTKEQEKETVSNFNSEIKMYDDINKIYTDIQSIHENF
jgi:type I restriction enzyme M protein